MLIIAKGSRSARAAQYIETGLISCMLHKGPYEKGTLYVKPLYRGHCLESQKTIIPYNLSIRDKTAEFLLFPKYPLFRGSTVIIQNF